MSLARLGSVKPIEHLCHCCGGRALETTTAEMERRRWLCLECGVRWNGGLVGTEHLHIEIEDRI